MALEVYIKNRFKMSWNKDSGIYFIKMHVVVNKYLNKNSYLFP